MNIEEAIYQISKNTKPLKKAPPVRGVEIRAVSGSLGDDIKALVRQLEKQNPLQKDTTCLT